MITILEYQPQWRAEFETIREGLQDALGTLSVSIDHIGSTAVPGMAAKDVIDIQVSVIELGAEVRSRLINAGYRLRETITRDHLPAGEVDDPDLWTKLFFNEPIGQRRINLHLRVAGRPNQRYALLFRNYLRAHPAAARTLEEVKRQLARRFPNDMDSYYAIKDPVCDLIWRAAQAWQPPAA